MKSDRSEASPSARAPTGAGRPRYEFVDWLRGLAAVLMFQTHLYDSWMVPGARHSVARAISQSLGAFPSRLFLLLAGASLCFRFDADRRAGLASSASRRGAVRRGLEVLGYGLAFRLVGWALGGLNLGRYQDLFRVDILNTIGISLVLAALVIGPREASRLPWRPAALALAIACLAPFVEHAAPGFPRWIPRPLTSYLAGERPMAFFPLMPWMSYLLLGMTVGSVWSRSSATGGLGRSVGLTTAAGLAMAAGSQIGRHIPVDPYRFAPGSIPGTSPLLFLYYGGISTALAGVAYLGCRLMSEARFSALKQMGRTSLFLYCVHVWIVYDFFSGPLHGRLSFAWASAALVVLTAAMLALSCGRTSLWPRARRGRAARAIAEPEPSDREMPASVRLAIEPPRRAAAGTRAAAASGSQPAM